LIGYKEERGKANFGKRIQAKNSLPSYAEKKFIASLAVSPPQEIPTGRTEGEVLEFRHSRGSGNPGIFLMTWIPAGTISSELLLTFNV
jgi:hypothetical protein